MPCPCPGSETVKPQATKAVCTNLTIQPWGQHLIEFFNDGYFEFSVVYVIYFCVFRIDFWVLVTFLLFWRFNTFFNSALWCVFVPPHRDRVWLQLWLAATGAEGVAAVQST